ncbi:MAG TPA: hypothetical protein VMT68_03390 [Caulobacteraceae bacterium]|nr:hypothetical protein [Caulobacteraceae bacterium]
MQGWPNRTPPPRFGPRPATARPADEPPELAALLAQERAHTLRTFICAVAVVLAAACLIPIANARPRYRPPPAKAD